MDCFIEYDTRRIHGCTRRIMCDDRSPGDLPGYQPESIRSRQLSLPALDSYGLYTRYGCAGSDFGPHWRYVWSGADV